MPQCPTGVSPLNWECFWCGATSTLSFICKSGISEFQTAFLATSPKILLRPDITGICSLWRRQTIQGMWLLTQQVTDLCDSLAMQEVYKGSIIYLGKTHWVFLIRPSTEGSCLRGNSWVLKDCLGQNIMCVCPAPDLPWVCTWTPLKMGY